MIIRGGKARDILNSRGEPTIELFLETDKGQAEASAPSGKSRGKYEAEPFSSKGINFSISFANALVKRLVYEKTSFNTFEDLEKFEKIVREYDKTKNWAVAGGNVVFVIEAAILKAIAKSNDQELWAFLNRRASSLPYPVGNCIGGGLHVKKEIKSDIQEFLLIPQAKTFFDAQFINLQAYKEVKMALTRKDLSWKGELTDENAFATSLPADKTLDLLDEVSSKINDKFGVHISLGMDMASSTLWNGSGYAYKNPKTLRKQNEQITLVLGLIKKHNLFYVEDPLHEEDFSGFSGIKPKSKCFIVGDDLIATQPDRLQKAIAAKSVNAVIVKPNQNGSLLDTKRFVDIAHKNNIRTVISHRSGETLDSTIADLAVAWKIPFIKTGILGRERFAKLNRLIKIERQIQKKA